MTRDRRPATTVITNTTLQVARAHHVGSGAANPVSAMWVRMAVVAMIETRRTRLSSGIGDHIAVMRASCDDCHAATR